MVGNVDIENVAAIAEKLLRATIYTLLEKVIDQECDLGQLDFTSLPPSVIDELKTMKEHLKDCEENESGTDFDKAIQHKFCVIINRQLEFALKTYHQSFYRLTYQLDLSDEYSFAYDSFVRVCRKIMQNEITWYRIVSLLCFGAEIAVFVMKRGKPGFQDFINKIVHYIVEFMVKEEIADWIKEHGGWMTMINFFDPFECPDRADHIFSLITIIETTSFEKWMQRIGICVVAGGLGYFLIRKYWK